MNSESNNHIETKHESFRLLNEAWELLELESSQATSKEMIKIEEEISRLKNEISSFNLEIENLEEENRILEDSFNQVTMQNHKLRSFKETLKNSLYSNSDTPTLQLKSTSPSVFQTERPIDGKNFFKEARLRLSYENFSVFLGYVKKLNDKQITRERALLELKDIFGDEHEDLFEDFSALILRKA